MCFFYAHHMNLYSIRAGFLDREKSCDLTGNLTHPKRHFGAFTNVVFGVFRDSKPFRQVEQDHARNFGALLRLRDKPYDSAHRCRCSIAAPTMPASFFISAVTIFA